MPAKADPNCEAAYVNHSDYSLQIGNWRELKVFKIWTDMKLQKIKYSGGKNYCTWKAANFSIMENI